jgi:phage shock protein C
MQKRLHRSRTEKMIAGVCGGIAEYLNVDPTLVRVLWVFIALLAGSGVLLYLILWIVMPLDVPEPPGPPAAPPGSPPARY